jgi:alpha-L-fucosidase 2
MYFWGMFTNANYGWNRKGLAVGDVTNRFIRREYTSSLELLAMMLDYYDYTRDESFLKDHLLPLSDSLLKFWDEHYQRNADGRMVIYPAQALETLQDARNPTPDVAGLLWGLGKLLELPEPTVGAERHTFWKQLEAAIPPLPMAGDDGQRWLLGAEQVFGGRGNSENPELYAVFPFRLYGVGKPDVDIGRRTFEKRTVRGLKCKASHTVGCWGSVASTRWRRWAGDQQRVAGLQRRAARPVARTAARPIRSAAGSIRLGPDRTIARAASCGRSR